VPYGYGERPFVGYLAQTAYKSSKDWVLVEYDMNIRDRPQGQKGWYRPDLYLANIATQECCTFEVKMDWIPRKKASEATCLSSLIEANMKQAREQLHGYSYICPWRESDYWCSLAVIRISCIRDDVARWRENPDLYSHELRQIRKVCKDILIGQNYSYQPNFYYRYFLSPEEVSNGGLWSKEETPPFGLVCIGRLESYRQIRR